MDIVGSEGSRLRDADCFVLREYDIDITKPWRLLLEAYVNFHQPINLEKP